ncbi:MAG: DNA mismatch repair endonuclease MutL [Caldilineae bacterium]|nr:MAG: DNA mismatch repair endonuclease MutL [Caldilineae bacterium]
MPIQILAPDVAAKIAAGEVVERPASVVKELIENAIDAGARTIRVEIRAGGKRLIRVSDDGCGIPADEVPLAFERHATSKVRAVEDLYAVRTLGFRGEALASVAAVSQLRMVTRPAEQTAGTQIRIEGGVRQPPEPVGAPAGTTVTVENLFFNVPARLKFLKADATETGHIHRVVSHYAMAYPEIRFSLHSNGRRVFHTDGSGALYDVLVSVWGLAVARQLLPVEWESEEGIAVSGYTGMPSLHRGARNQIVFFVNRRWIQDRALGQAVAQAYHTFLPVGRHPVAVLNLTLNPADVDVNVHPTKAEVKFRDPRAVFTAVQRPVRAAITHDAPLTRPAQAVAGEGGRWEGEGHAGDFARHAPGPAWSRFGLEAQRPLSGEAAFEPAAEEGGLPPLRLVGQIQQMYVIAEGPDGLYLIDQHAAHERILYERLMAQQQTAAVASQRLLTPLLLELSPAQAAIVAAEMEALTAAGFALEPFGGSSYRLLAVPDMLARADPAAAFADILDEMAEGALPMARQTHERVAIIVCKRAAIKGGQTLSTEEMRELIDQLEACQNPRTCPHGRPTMIHMSAYQLAREFGRH